MSLRQWARSRNIPLSTASKAALAGRIDRLPNGRVDPDAADRVWVQRTHRRAGGRVPRPPVAAGDGDGIDVVATAPASAAPTVRRPRATRGGADATHGTVNAAQAELLSYKALNERLKYLERTGELIEASVVRAAAFECGRTTRGRLETIPARLAPTFVGLDANTIHDQLMEEIREACTEIASWGGADGPA